MQIEEGKYYKTRDGRKVGPTTASGDPYWPFDGKFLNPDGTDNEASFRRDGTCPYLPEHDLIEEWAE